MNVFIAFSLILGLFSLQACTNSSTKQNRNLTDTAKTSDSLAISTSDSTTSLISPKTDSSKGQIFLVRSYRIWEKEDPTAVLNKDWYDLYEENGQYYLDKVDFEVKDGFDDCAQVATKSVESRRNSLLFLKLKGLKTGALEHLKINQSEIWPKESVQYTFKNQKIALKALGDIKSTEVQTDENGHEKVFHEVANYKLNYSSINGNKEKTLFQVNQYDHVFMSTLFVGDIDRDGALDFIFSNPKNYEEEAMLLFLSNHGNPLMFEAEEQFDC
ncbi:hypothetical protein [Sphingobacterium sp.]|uniref:hypothetical protein n=1 Tax=Sphingobacterium sp. TaxID=341027 RepID=UPI0031D7F71D